MKALWCSLIPGSMPARTRSTSSTSTTRSTIVYAAVTQAGKIKDEEHDSYFGTNAASSEITVDKELSVKDFIASCVMWITAHYRTRGPSTDRVYVDKKAGVSGTSLYISAMNDSAQVGSSGSHASIAASGHSPRIASTGFAPRIAASGEYAWIGSASPSAHIVVSGDFSKIICEGLRNVVSTAGKAAQVLVSGWSRVALAGSHSRVDLRGDDCHVAVAGNDCTVRASGLNPRVSVSGNYAYIEATGPGAIVASAGLRTCASGEIGTWICLAEYSDGRCVGFAQGCIGQDGLEPHVFYRASGGRLVKV